MQGAYVEGGVFYFLSVNFVKTRTFCLDNLIVREISVETDISRGLYHFSIIGMGDKAIDESRGRIQSAIKNSGFKGLKSTNQKITVLLAPASVKKEGSSFDLAIAVSYLFAVGHIQIDLKKYVFLAELSLNGELRAPKNFLYLFREVLKQDHESIIVTSYECADICEYFINDRIIYCKNIREVIDIESSENKDTGLDTEKYNRKVPSVSNSSENTFDYINGCESAKRALVIAVAGRHNLLMVGPPGTGKTLLAKCVSELSPPLSKPESFECTSLHQINVDGESKCPIFFPPFREPHHTSSYSAVVGDAQLNAGEITKAHNGFLLLDELPEFESRVIDALREPLESGKLTLSKRKGSVTLPANFTLIATMNPCKCGFRGSDYKKCICRNIDAIKYSQKISGPILDRFDMLVHVDITDENNSKNEYISKIAVKDKINSAIKNSKIRFAKHFPNKPFVFNGKLSISHFGHAKEKIFNISQNSILIIEDISKKLNLSKRAVSKIIKVARTIADLENSEQITESHLYEALSSRQNISE